MGIIFLPLVMDDQSRVRIHPGLVHLMAVKTQDYIDDWDRCQCWGWKCDAAAYVTCRIDDHDAEYPMHYCPYHAAVKGFCCHCGYDVMAHPLVNGRCNNCNLMNQNADY